MTSDKHTGQQLHRDQYIYLWTDEMTDADAPIEVRSDYQGDDEAMSNQDRMYYQANTESDILGDTTADMQALSEFIENFHFDIRTYKVEEPIIEDLDNPSNNGTITTNDGNLYITMDYKHAKVTVPFSYINEFSSLDTNINEYVFPLYIDDTTVNEEDFVPIHVDVEGSIESSEYGDISFRLTHYGRNDIDEREESSESSSGLILRTGGLHMLKLELTDVPWESSESDTQEALDISLNADLKLTLTWDTSVSVAEYMTLMEMKIVGGINDSLSDYASLDEVMDRINELMAQSNDSDAIPYITYEPESSMAIQNEEL